MKSVVEQGSFHEFAFDNKALETFVEFRICWKLLQLEHCQIWIRSLSHLYFKPLPTFTCVLPTREWHGQFIFQCFLFVRHSDAYHTSLPLCCRSSFILSVRSSICLPWLWCDIEDANDFNVELNPSTGHFQTVVLCVIVLCTIVYTMFTVSSTLMWAVLTGPADWVCHIGTLTPCIEAVA